MELLFEGRSDLSDFRGFLRFVQNRPTILPEPVVRPDSFTDKNGVSIYGTVLRDSGCLRMWYQAIPADWDWKRDMSSVAYAESDDGVTWRKPKLGVVKHGPEDNNLIDLGLHCPSVFIDPDSPPSHRYRATGCGYGALFMKNPAVTEMGYYTSHSADGLHWELDAPRPRWSWMDVITSAYHPARRAATIAMKRTVRIGRIYRRAIWTAEFRKGAYSEALSALLPDEFDDIAAIARGCVSADYYGMGMMPAGRTGMIGFLWPYYHEPPYAPNVGLFGFSDITLVYQQEAGGRWVHFPGRRSFIEHGTQPWMAGWLNTASTPVEVGDEQWLYFAGTSYSHGFYLDEKWQPRDEWIAHTKEHGRNGIGIAKWPKNRLVGYEADPSGSFAIDLGPVREPSQLVINYTTRPGGSVRVSYERGAEKSEPVALSGEATAQAVGSVIMPRDESLVARIELECATAWAIGLRPPR